MKLTSRRFLAASLSAGVLVGLTVGASLSVQAEGTKEKSVDGKNRPHMDIAFCIDTTGSMSGEIEMVKEKTKAIVAKLASGNPAPIVRVALVAYRDRGDDYVTKVFPFSDNIDKVVKDISSLTAGGGGDTPESVNEAMHVSVEDLKWATDKQTSKLLFLIGDAGPHVYPNDYSWKTESKNAIAKGIQINTIGCAGLVPGPDGADVFKQIAKLADGKYADLAYRQEVADSHGVKSTIVNSGGSYFKIAGGATDAWKRSAAEGAMTRIDSPVASASIASPASARAGMPGAAMAGGAYRSRAEARPMASPAAAGVGGMGVNRADNNLDELVLSAARDKAKKELNVSY